MQSRARLLRAAGDAPGFLAQEIAEDVADRAAFLRLAPGHAVLVGDTGPLAEVLSGPGWHVQVVAGVDEEAPLLWRDLALLVSANRLESVNDLPGALVHARRALRPGGLMVASLLGAGSLPKLRAAMLAADGERPAPRLHPQVDIRAGGQLLQRAGFADPVVDTRTLLVRYRSLTRLVGDLRMLGLTNVLARSGPPLTRAGLARAEAAFSADDSPENFEILTLSGRAPSH